MHTHWFDPELVRFAFLLGIVVATLLYERFQLTCGSVVVPGYLGLAWPSPRLAVGTFAAAWLVYVAIHVLAARFWVLSRSGKFYVAVSLAAALQALSIGAAEYMGVPQDLGWISIGFVVPGLIAHDMARQGPWKSTGAIVAASGVVALFVFSIAAWEPRLCVTPARPDEHALAFESSFLPVAMLASVLVATGLQRNHGLRAGGFIGAAYLAQIVTHPFELACYASFAAITYVVVVFGLKPALMLFGRRKFASMLVVGGLVSWAGLSLGPEFLPAHWFEELSSGRAVMSVFFSGLIANDVDRSGFGRTLRGTAIAIGFSLAGTLVAVECAGPSRFAVVVPLTCAALVVGAWAYHADLRRLAKRAWSGSGLSDARVALAAPRAAMRRTPPWLVSAEALGGAALLLIVVAAITRAPAAGVVLAAEHPTVRVDESPAARTIAPTEALRGSARPAPLSTTEPLPPR